MTTTTSLSLLERAASSDDSESWNRLVAVYTPLLRQWLSTYDVQRADADDLIQDVLTAVLRELPSFRHNQQTGAFRNWLRKILVNRLRGFWRARNYQPLVGGDSNLIERLNQLEDDHSPGSQIWNAEHDRHVLSRLIAAVRPRFQQNTWDAFCLQMLQGERADAVAARLGMPLNSVYVARSRVLSALRQEAAGLIELS